MATALTKVEREKVVARFITTEQGRNMLRRSMGFVRWYERLFGFSTYIETTLRKPGLLVQLGAPEFVAALARRTFERLASFGWWLQSWLFGR